MPEFYRIHFGYSKSKRYSQALELAKLAYKHSVQGEGKNLWHTVVFTDKQIDLMAATYNICNNLGELKINGAPVIALMVYFKFLYPSSEYAKKQYSHYTEDNAEQLLPGIIDKVRFAARKLRCDTGKEYEELEDYLSENLWGPYTKDMREVWEKLRAEGYIDLKDIYGNVEKKAKKPKEYIDEYRIIKELISKKRYSEAVYKYYEKLGKKFYGDLHSELIYLKRLAKMPLSGRDLLFFKTESSRNDLITNNLSEYCTCIDSILERYSQQGMKTPLDLLLEFAPDMQGIVQRRERKRKQGIWLKENGQLEWDNRPVTLESFGGYADCYKGRLFNKYPDQVKLCRQREFKQDDSLTPIWIRYSPKFHKKKISNVGLHIHGVDGFIHRLWNRRKKEPSFFTAKSLQDIKKESYATDNIQYTGNTHVIDGKRFYEIELIRKDWDHVIELGNPFLELVEELLREAENFLRENHGLPRIGEGWISEMQLFDLVKNVFPEAHHHASPDWLKPQHLDIYIPSEKLAFEYQGRQHFEPVDFFGGEESFKQLQKLDRRKENKCKTNNVSLIYWRYDEPITQEILVQKLKGNDKK